MLTYVIADSTSVPLLTRLADAETIREYLAWLIASPFCYHLDDDAEDCGFPPAIGTILNANQGVMWHTDALTWNEIWEAYYPDDRATA